jgi:hypothetical protein
MDRCGWRVWAIPGSTEADSGRSSDACHMAVWGKHDSMPFTAVIARAWEDTDSYKEAQP